ncbi:Olfactory receptor 2C3 [Frankliniella fusca]|uniref:Olfactory receptor 2C3 n=1 Tax=Frankliniella fusca TaxID=407009 RepID=A0AAE1LNW1_9NEOP|nr:Olfactory receptor 2C3 [Frankliniella fusca]
MAEAGETSEMNTDSPARKKSCRHPIFFQSENAIKVSNLSREITFMEFSNFAIAEAVSKLRNVVWQKETLVSELAVYAHDTIVDETMDVSEILRPPMFASTPAHRTVVMLPTTPTLPQGDTSEVEVLMKGCSPFKKVRRKRNTLFHNTNGDKELVTQSSSVTVLADSANDMQNLTLVLFENIEEPFKEADFKLFLEKQIEKKCVIPDKDKIDKSFIITEYRSDEKSVIVQFSSIAVAEAVCVELQYKEYMGENLALTLIKPVTRNHVLDDNSKDVEIVTPVLFENIEEPFKEADFKLFLEKQIEKKCVIPDKDKIDKSFIITEYKSDEKSVIVQFSSIAVAEAVCVELQFKEYMGENLALTLMESVTRSPLIVDNGKDVEIVTPVLFENIEEPFKEEDFTLFLKRQLEKKCEIPDKDKVDLAFVIKEYKANEKSVIVEFLSVKVAQAVCKELQFKEYMGEKLTLSLENDIVNSRGSNMDESEYVGPLGSVFPLDDTNEPKISLESEEGKVILNEALLKTRSFFSNKHNHSTGYVQIISYLKSKEVDATIPDVTRMRRNLSNNYNTHKKRGNFAWPNYKLCSIIFDGAEITENERVKYDDALIPMDSVAVCKLFTKGAVFTAESRSYLINIITQNSDKRGSMFFWDNVSSLMEKQGYYYSAGDSKEEFGSLEKVYKDIEGTRRRTSAPSTQFISNWKHFNEMRELAKNDVAHNPAFTFSAGSSSLTVTNTEALTRRDSRVNPLKKPQTKAEMKSAISSGVLEQLKRSNDLKERYLQSRES